MFVQMGILGKWRAKKDSGCGELGQVGGQEQRGLGGRSVRPHSWRNAVITGTRVARRAGR
jgi:hypothetical protein